MHRLFLFQLAIRNYKGSGLAIDYDAEFEANNYSGFSDSLGNWKLPVDS
jgi:hypothetical protein